MTTPEKPRWLYRLENYGRAFSLLREAMEIMDSRPLTQLEKEGVIQRFEFTWELAWKLLKDYLEASGVALETITPAAVIRAGFAAKIIQEGDIWMQALDARNKMSHTYNFKNLRENHWGYPRTVFCAAGRALYGHDRTGRNGGRPV